MIVGRGYSHLVSRAKHAKVRAAERYGLEIGVADLAEIRRRIEALDQRCAFLWQQDDVLSHWAIWHGGEWIPVIYDASMRAIVTFLPKCELRRNRDKLPW